jgi:hypothetical protein
LWKNYDITATVSIKYYSSEVIIVQMPFFLQDEFAGCIKAFQLAEKQAKIKKTECLVLIESVSFFYKKISILFCVLFRRIAINL